MIIRLKEAKHDEERAHLIHIRNDILWFCDAMYRLVKQAIVWLKKITIKYNESLTHLTDKSVILWPDSKAICYEINKLSMYRHGAEAELIPLAIYGEAGARGQGLLQVAFPGNQNSYKAYILSLDRCESTWSIRRQEDSINSRLPLDERNFREALSTLVQSKRRL
ncbi:MAG: hypothetical protein LBE90_18320 [Pantoea dispersa]|nr:hypothetical protein [Pantoea dispersa]MBZ6392442.1 hypothetical protein [Pantoea dispersa]